MFCCFETSHLSKNVKCSVKCSGRPSPKANRLLLVKRATPKIVKFCRQLFWIILLIIETDLIRCKCRVRLWRWRPVDAHYVLDKISEFRCCSIDAVDIQSMNVFLCLPLARLPPIIPLSVTASNWFFLIAWPTNRICLLTVTFRRFLDVLAL